MRTAILALAGLAHLAAAGINITQNNDVNLANGTGALGWGASGLPWGYSAGVGFNFNVSNDELSGGYNAAVPGSEGTTSFGGGYTVNSTGVILGLGGVLGETTFGISLVQDRATGVVTVMVNGKEVAM